MKLNPLVMLSCAVAALALACPAATPAQNQKPANAKTDAHMRSSATAHRTASQMVGAQAALKGNLDAKKLRDGSDVHLVLTHSAKLKNGVKLPRGTTLVGKVETDLRQPGKSTLTLRFTEARLKNGKQIPIHATIVGVMPPPTGIPGDMDAQVVDTWDGKSTQFDQIGAFSGTDLHSRIAARNSGTFISKKDDVKLSSGSQLALAIGARGNA